MNEEQTIRDAIATLEADGFRVVWGRYGSGFADDGRIIGQQGAEGCCPMTAVARVSPECGNSVIGTAANYLKVSPEWCVGFVTGWDHPQRADQIQHRSSKRRASLHRGRGTGRKDEQGILQ